MAKIKKLSAQEAQKIAAGEVVERPANIVKELLENSLDADSTQISIYVEDGGKKLIKIVDNGSGMSPEDSLMSIEHHATSKISSVDDLETLKTFGFRGEALSSISAISLMSIKTKTKESQAGIILNIEWAKILNQEIASCNTGTEITVKDIFNNIPARKKFLKARETELRAIIQLFFAAVLSYKNVHFKFFSENKAIYNCPPVHDIKSRISQLYDQNLTSNIITHEVEDQKNSIKISCAVTGPEFTKYDRSNIFFFVNSRWVKNYKLSQAIMKGYMNILPDGKFPAAFVLIDIDPKLIDVNIHPRKDEVLFFNPKIIENNVQNCVKLALEKFLSDKIKPASIINNNNNLNSLNNNIKFNINNPINLHVPDKVNFNSGFQVPENPINISRMPRENIIKIFEESFNSSKAQEVNINPSVNSQEKIFVNNNIIINPAISKTPENSPENINYKILGQLCKTYILIEVADGMLMVDQHAAHERILYEKFANKFEEIEQIKLISPVFLYLQEADINIALENIELFKEYGLEIEQFSKDQLIITSTPVIIQKESIENIVKYILEILKEYGTINNNNNNQDIKKSITERVHAQMSCKAAVKSGDSLNFTQMTAIINDLYSTPNRFTCPHGRPTFWHSNITEINKKFKRPNISNS